MLNDKSIGISYKNTKKRSKSYLEDNTSSNFWLWSNYECSMLLFTVYLTQKEQLTLLDSVAMHMIIDLCCKIHTIPPHLKSRTLLRVVLSPPLPPPLPVTATTKHCILFSASTNGSEVKIFSMCCLSHLPHFMSIYRSSNLGKQTELNFMWAVKCSNSCLFSREASRGNETLRNEFRRMHSAWNFILQFFSLFLLLYQHLQIKTWRGNNLGVNSFQLSVCTELQKVKCSKANSLRSLQSSRQWNWKRLLWKSVDGKRAREPTSSQRVPHIYLITCRKNCSFSTHASEPAGIYWPFGKTS